MRRRQPPITQLTGGQFDQRIRAALRAAPLVIGATWRAERVQRRLQNGAVLSVQLTAKHEGPAEDLVARKPTPLVVTVVGLQRAVGVEAMACEGCEDAHAPRVERLGGRNQGLLHAGDGVSAHLVGKPSDERDVGEAGAAGVEARGGARKPNKHARHPHAIRRPAAGQTAGGAEPRHRADRTLRQRSAAAIEPLEAAHELCLEAVHEAAHADQLVPKLMSVHAVDLLTRQARDGAGQLGEWGTRGLQHESYGTRTDVRIATSKDAKELSWQGILGVKCPPTCAR